MFKKMLCVLALFVPAMSLAELATGQVERTYQSGNNNTNTSGSSYSERFYNQGFADGVASCERQREGRQTNHQLAAARPDGFLRCECVENGSRTKGNVIAIRRINGIEERYIVKQDIWYRPVVGDSCSEVAGRCTRLQGFL